MPSMISHGVSSLLKIMEADLVIEPSRVAIPVNVWFSRSQHEPRSWEQY